MVAVHPDADLIGIAVGTNDFYTTACPFGSTEAPEKLIEEMKQRYQYDESVNMIGLGEIKKGMKLLSTSYTLGEGSEYTVCLNIPIVPGCEYRVNGGYRSWFLDADKNALNTLNLKDQDFRFVAPEGACYISITFSGDISAAYMYGAISDIDTNLTLSTFCGAIHTICKYLQTNYKGKDIVFVTPIERYQSWCNKPETPNSLGYTLNDYADAIIEICSGYSIPVIDFYRYSGINPHIDKSMFGDTDGKAVHPNEEGHKILASVVTRYLKDLKKQ
jgi:lysophospholipase L1-like esterase